MRGSSDSGTGNDAALRAMHERDGLAPVPLPREDPVAQLVVHGPRAHAVALQLFDDPELGRFGLQPAELARVDRIAVLDVAYRGFRCEVGARFVLRLGRDYLDDGEVELLREIPIPIVVGGDRHDGPGPVGDEHVVGDPDGDAIAAQGVDRVCAGKYAGTSPWRGRCAPGRSFSRRPST